MTLRQVVQSLFFLATFCGEDAHGGERPARTDHYGDPLPPGVRYRLGTVRLRHQGEVKAVAWLPDGRTLASVGADHTLRLWQIPGGKPLGKRDCPENAVFTPDGRFLTYYANEEEPTFCVVDVASGKLRRRIRVTDSGGFPETLSPDGKCLVIVDKTGIRVREMESGKELGFLKRTWKNPGVAVPALVFAPDGETIVGPTEDGAFSWNPRTGAKRSFVGMAWAGAQSFTFAPDGKALALVTYCDSSVYVSLRSWPAGKELRRLELENHQLGSAAFSPDGKLLATSDDWGIIHLWEPATGKLLRSLEGNQNPLFGLAFSPDGSLLAAAGELNAVTVWEVRPSSTSRPLTGVGHWLVDVEWAADGQSLVTRSPGGGVTLWDGRDGRRLRTRTGGDEVANRFVYGAETARTLAQLWQEVESGRDPPEKVAKHIRSSAFCPAGNLLAVGGYEGILLLHKTGSKPAYRLLDYAGRAQEVQRDKIDISPIKLVYSPDGQTLAASYTHGFLILWQPRTGRLLHRLAFAPSVGGSSQTCLAFSPDSRLLAVAEGRDVLLMEVASGQKFRSLHFEDISLSSLAFAPDGRTLALGGSTVPDPAKNVEGYEPIIRLWDWPANKAVLDLRSREGDVRTLLFSPDGSSLLSRGDDYTVLCWDVADLRHRQPNVAKLPAAQLTDLWADLASREATRAQQAVAALILAPNSALPFLDQQLKLAPAAEMERVQALIAQLDHEDFRQRERATAELSKLTSLAAPALRQAIKDKPSLETRKRLEALLAAGDAAPLSADQLRTFRALQVPESIGTPEARRILDRLAAGASGAVLTEEAKAARQRLDQRGLSSTSPR